MNIINANNEPTGGVPRIPFKFRAECLRDCDIVRTVLQPWIVTWKDGPDYLDTPQGWRELPDRIVEMELRVDQFTRSLDQVRWVLAQFTDVHVIVETIQYADLYTGERIWEPDYGRISEETVPDNNILSVILSALKELVVTTNDLSNELVDAGEKILASWKELGRRPSIIHD